MWILFHQSKYPVNNMKITRSINPSFSALARAIAVAGCVVFGTSVTQAGNLLSCTSSQTGDLITRGFYITSYPGITLDSATLAFSATGAGTYHFGLTVRAGTYDGAVLGTSEAAVDLTGNSTQSKQVPFYFPSLKITKGSRVCFVTKLVSGPAGQTTYFSVSSSWTDGCAEVVETEGTNPPLSVFRRNGVELSITGKDNLAVTTGGVIQPAIDHADPGDTVSVGPGTYNENIVLRSDVNVIGAGFASTILRGLGSGRVVQALSVTNCRMEGFKITNSGNGSGDAGVYIQGGSPAFNNNWIIGNINGIRIESDSSALIRNNVVEGNGNSASSSLDYGILCLSSKPLIANNLIINNTGVGIYFAWAASTGAQVINNTIAGNKDSGIWCYQDANVIIKNNILTANSTGISASHGSTTPLISFNDVWANNWKNYDAQSGGVAAAGPGDISADPKFDPAGISRYALLRGSPCIDAGDPALVYNDRDGSRNDMGAHGGPSGLLPGLASPLTTGFLFNNIGKIPTSEITRSGSLAGLANVTPAVASALSIYPYKDAPFGGMLWIHGLFGMSDSTVQYYKIFAAKWNGNTPPAAGDFQPITDPLTKIKYTITSDGHVVSTPVQVGPNADGYYQRTDSGYWSFPDLKMIWNTLRLENGRYDLICKGYQYRSLLGGRASVSPGIILPLFGYYEVALPTNDLSRITLLVDNSPVVAELVSVRDRNGNVIPECGFINVATDRDPLQFEIKAYHTNGFLQYYGLSALYGRNRSGGVIASDQYVGAHDSSRPFWNGPNPILVNAGTAFTAGTLAPWTTCSYQFYLEAYARTTDGFNLIYGASFNDHYFINVGPGTQATCTADLNGDGVVDGADLAIFASQYGHTNGVKKASLPR